MTKLPPAPPNGPHEVFHRGKGDRRWRLVAVYPDRRTAWDAVLALPPGDVRLQPAGSHPPARMRTAV